MIHDRERLEGGGVEGEGWRKREWQGNRERREEGREERKGRKRKPGREERIYLPPQNHG